MKAAAKIQETFLPREAPRVPGTDFAWVYRPCDELAGDGLNVIPLGDGKVGLYILDVTVKSAPVVLGSLRYLTSGTYCHSGLLSADKQFFMINDEFDESQGSVSNCSTHVIDVSNLSNPVERTVFHNPLQIIDHNSMMQDGFMFLAAYRGGIRVYDPSNPLALSEVGFFDSYTGPDAFSYDALLSLPMWHGMSDKQQDCVVDALARELDALT